VIETEVPMINILFAQLQRRQPLPPRPVLTPGDAGTAPDDTPPRGCGWFDSSHELRRGLVVCEHASPDTLAGELPLASWLELHLSGWRPAAPA
jgi:hypothetical protein